MPLLSKGRYVARFADGPEDVAAAQRLRALAFHGADAPPDHDSFDDSCLHVLVEDTARGALVCAYRLLALDSGGAIEQSYSAQHYGLSRLACYDGKMLEVGRFCIHPDHSDPDILRVAWGALTAYVDAASVQMLFGCSSFKGTSGEAYLDAFALLKARHLAPPHWLPRVKAASIFPYADRLELHRPDMKTAMQSMPPLLRTYLAMGGWVSDHAVIDEEMNTLHVFTGLEITAIPPARKKLLRAVVG
ncbi:GNAT family N-acetyltransferase [Litoreibacter albidus]|uniref:L-ornithine N(alpha)-acyltransferase n=1 Tax=Litoreibacter albidus TaxID=670155 RepID=A0A1H2YC34_9RHOB|nr:GNAT family N-acyltransferase [Litoreibacter albidus]SDX02782.1 ornithine-acyl[acyl carrier protein] N-acyltransferase [Litoreibacter albidus]